MADINFEYVTTQARLKEILPELFTYDMLAIDTESRGLDPYQPNTLRSIQISTSATFSYVINTAVVDPRPLKNLFENPKIIKLLHNAKFDYKMLKQQCGISLTNIFDSMLAERIITCGLYRKNSLYEVCKKYLDVTLDKTIRKGFIGSVEIDLSSEEQAYAARDTQVLFSLHPILVSKLKEQDLWATLILENQCIPAIAETELAGVLIDVEKWQRLIDNNTEKNEQVAKELEAMAVEATGYQQVDLFGNVTSGINFNSNPQLVALFDDLNIDASNTKKATLAKLDAPFVKILLEHKEHEKQLNSFGDKFLNLINPYTGRIHPDFNQIGADSGRFSCSNPNLQQIPADSDFRSCFVARPGYKIITSDFSGQELRVLTELSRDPTYIKAFLSDDPDLHRATAAGIYNISEDQVTKKQRQAAKIINFSCAYGAGAAKIAASLEITKQEGEEILEKFYRAIPKLKAWLDKAGKDAFKNGFAVTAIGRKRYFTIPSRPDTTGMSYEDAKEARKEYQKTVGSIERAGKNMCIQGASVDMVKLALISLHKILKRYDARIINCVHDELVVEVREDQAEEVAKIVAHEMVKAGEKIISIIPVAVDVHIENCWSKE